LRVGDLDLMLSFYVKDLGLKMLRPHDGLVELRTAGSSSEPLLVLYHDAKAEVAPEDAAGLYHYAILLPDRRTLAAAYLALRNRGVTFEGFADHLVSEALYLTDPEGNGIEIYVDRPRSEWKFDEDGRLKMSTEPLDIDSLIKESPQVPPGSLEPLPDDAKIGHIHLKVADIDRSILFYRDILGFDLMSYWGSAAFLSAGRYHHHLGINTWESLGGPGKPKTAIGLEYFIIRASQENLHELALRLTGTPFLQAQEHSQLFLSDPDSIELVIKPSS